MQKSVKMQKMCVKKYRVKSWYKKIRAKTFV